MRQRRQRLQVSTFPFLAVLLCAMGSLILLLLVMDRRAKVVARAKAMRAMDQALAQATAEDERAAAAHRAEWERRRQLLHEQLQQQDEQVLQELQGVQQQLTTAAASVQTELARSHDLREQLQTERSTLARAEEDLTARRAEVARAAQQTEGSRTKLARLTADLERMEHCMAELQAARQRQQQMVSLVPYRGKRGDNRKPLYIECNGDELIFHPDRLALHGATLGPSAIRDEIDRRLAQQHSETKAVNAKSEASAYLLMLIRPNGIQTYYQTLAALKGLRLDFGYEFLDQDWILDFSEDDGKPKQQPWMTAERTQERQPSSPSAKKVEGAGPAHSARPEKPYQGLASGGSGSGRPMGTFTSGSAGSGHSVVQGAGMDASGQGLFAGATAGNRQTSRVQPPKAMGGELLLIPEKAGRLPWRNFWRPAAVVRLHEQLPWTATHSQPPSIVLAKASWFLRRVGPLKDRRRTKR